MRSIHKDFYGIYNRLEAIKLPRCLLAFSCTKTHRTNKLKYRVQFCTFLTVSSAEIATFFQTRRCTKDIVKDINKIEKSQIQSVESSHPIRGRMGNMIYSYAGKWCEKNL
jgi:hypothetical protein